MRKGFSLDRLETRLQQLIEVRLVTLLPGTRWEDVVVHQLAAVVRSSIDSGSSEGELPTTFHLRVPPADVDQWRDNTELLDEMTRVIRTMITESGVEMDVSPTLQVVSDASLDAGDIKIEAVRAERSVAETRGVPAEERQAGAEEAIPASAFLIVGGVKVFPLNRSVINIGRRSDNHLVLDDPRVSRYHAQVRAIRGRFVLFDLSSTGGTFVNGQRTSQCVLYPGDVVSLAGLSIIFGQDNPPSGTRTLGTEPLKPPAVSDRPTVVFKRPPEEDPQA